MIRIKHLLAILSLCLFVTACQHSNDISQLPRALKIHATVSNSIGNFQPDVDDRFYWPKAIELHPAEQQQAQTQIAMVIRELNQQLQQKGYTLSDSPYDSRYYLQGAIVYGNKIRDPQLQQLFGMEAGLGNNEQDYQRGSLLLAITNPSGLPIWRGAVQIFTEQNLPTEIKKQRLSLALSSMLSNLPNIATATH